MKPEEIIGRSLDPLAFADHGSVSGPGPRGSEGLSAKDQAFRYQARAQSAVRKGAKCLLALEEAGYTLVSSKINGAKAPIKNMDNSIQLVDFFEAMADRHSDLRKRPDLVDAVEHTLARYRELQSSMASSEASRTAQAEGIAMLLNALE